MIIGFPIALCLGLGLAALILVISAIGGIMIGVSFTFDTARSCFICLAPLAVAAGALFTPLIILCFLGPFVIAQIDRYWQTVFSLCSPNS